MFASPRNQTFGCGAKSVALGQSQPSASQQDASYAITSSARARSVEGIRSPSAFAVQRLITSFVLLISFLPYLPFFAYLVGVCVLFPFPCPGHERTPSLGQLPLPS
jgi:hypothetical protein